VASSKAISQVATARRRRGAAWSARNGNSAPRAAHGKLAERTARRRGSHHAQDRARETHGTDRLDARGRFDRGDHVGGDDGLAQRQYHASGTTGLAYVGGRAGKLARDDSRQVVGR